MTGTPPLRLRCTCATCAADQPAARVTVPTPIRNSHAEKFRAMTPGTDWAAIDQAAETAELLRHQLFEQAAASVLDGDRAAATEWMVTALQVETPRLSSVADVAVELAAETFRAALRRLTDGI